MSEEVVKKERFTVKSASQQLIGGHLVWGVILYVPYLIIVGVLLANLIPSFGENSPAAVWGTLAVTVVLTCLELILQWMLSTKFAFKKHTMCKNLIPKVMKVLAIYVILSVAFCTFVQVKDTKKEIDKELAAKESEIKMIDHLSYSTFLHSDEENAAHVQEIDAQLKEARTHAEREANMVTIVSAVVNLLMNWIILFTVEKHFLKKATDEKTDAIPESKESPEMPE